jgi:CRP/FNR family transcriptional regulator, cyclic AMP receptor protein
MERSTLGRLLSTNPSREATVKAAPMEPHHQVVDVLARAPLFRALDERVLRQLAGRLPQRVVAKGAAIFVQEELGDRMFVLADGVVKLVLRSARGQVIELVRHRPPAVFGEVSVLDGGPRSATAEAVQESRLLVVAREEFLRLMRSDMQVADALLRSLGEMVRRTTRQMSALVFLDMRARVARQLLQLAGDGTATPPVTQSELAEMVGATRQTVNRALRGLEQDGHIRMGRRIRILDEERLRQRTFDW